MQSRLTFLGIIAAFLLVAAWLGHRNSKRTRIQLQKRFLRSFGQIPDKKMSPERYRSVPGYFRHHSLPQQLDDITWNDLDMDRIYHRLDSTRSAAGEEYLYYALRTPALSAEELPVREESLAWFADSAEIRLSYELLLHRLGSTGKVSLLDYLDRLDELGNRSNALHYVSILLPVVCIVIMFFNAAVGVVLLVVALIFNMLTYLEQKRQIEPYIVSFRYLLRLLQVDEEIARIPAEDCKTLAKDKAQLQEILPRFGAFRRGSFMLMSGSGTGNPLDIIMDYVRMLFHLDLIKFNQMLHQVQERREDIDTLLTITGRIDTEIAVASFRKSLPDYCVPKLVPYHVPQEQPQPHISSTSSSSSSMTGPSLSAEQLFHPLLAHPVANTIHAKKPILLTGSNASGKSTFLKAVALSALFAQTLHTVCAKSYEAPYFRIYSSMALRDNMQAGDSYFMVEIKSLKRIMDASRIPAPPVLCFIDEVLRGTNTIERIAASSEILETFARAETLVFAATHDIELSDLLASSYDNYHFEETLTDDPQTGRQDVHFSYQLLPGKAHTRNAIRLLSAVGFDPSVTQKAQQRAETFERTGVWK